VAIVGFLGWCGGVIAYILKGFQWKERGKIATAGIVATIFLGFCLWIIGLINA